MRLGAALAPALEPRRTALEPSRCDIVAVAARGRTVLEWQKFV
jgi:hypothetical protein